MSQKRKLGPEEIEALKRQEVELLTQKLTLYEGLPHIFGWKWYPWAKQIYESFNREIFVTAANQISKSSTAIRKNIEWATNEEIWKKAWPSLAPGQKPNQFWYFYPTLDVATIEFESKLEPLFLPRNEYKTHPKYGWKAEYNKNQIHSICFNSGVTIYFKSYEQKVANLQTGTVYHVTLDEECPEHLLPEIQARLNASDGYLLSVFTATLGQLYWEKTMEPKSKEEELHKNALKLQVSMYDCITYDDGAPSHWTPEKIKRAIERCATPAEVARRIMGRFVKSEGLRFHGFDREKNFVKRHPLPIHWLCYGGVDPGSGGITGHPAGIIFLKVSPDFKQARVTRGWRGDGVSTTSQDILNKYKELKHKYGLKPVLQIYDYAAKDFYLVSSRQGEPFMMANKDRESGFGLVNTLFKNNMLAIQDGDPELEKLVSEMCSIPETAKKSDSFTDDLADALRYVCEAIPWDFSDHERQNDTETEIVKELSPDPDKTSSDLRREWFMSETKVADEIDEELDYWNDIAGT
jgi:phage terminase large subunit-like protein